MADFTFYYPTSTATNSSQILRFNPANVEMTQPSIAPIQFVDLAADGTEYISQISVNREETWRITFYFLPEADTTLSTYTRAGKNSLFTWLENQVNYRFNTCQITDPDGTSLTGRFMGGWEGFQEGGRAQGQGKQQIWFGELSFRKTLAST